MANKKTVVIVGAGLVGSLLGIYLAKRGYSITIFERRPDMRLQQISAGRSINLALSDRGLLALEKIGLSNAIKQICIPMHGRYIHQQDGSHITQPYGKDGQYINSVSRATLNMQLISLAEESGVKIYFNYKCVGVNWNENTVNFETDNQQIITHSFELLFGSDGAFATSRLQHQFQHSNFNYQQYYINCSYKELTIPPTANGNFAMEVNALHIWPRGGYMLIALPNLDKSFTCTLFAPSTGNASFEQLNSNSAIQHFFETNFANAIALMPNYLEQFLNNPTSSLVTVKCYPWVRENKFALIGDAAHAIVPFFGQGMNCGFEDCYVLDSLIDKYNEDWDAILQDYQNLRKPDADAIADLAVNNFYEMSTKTADPNFLLQKKLEAQLHNKYPQIWIPAYTQVTFSPHIRYSQALKQGQLQEQVMQQIMQQINFTTTPLTENIEQQILQALANAKQD